MDYREAFDYEKMAQEAERERDALHEVLERRKAHPPMGGDQELVWRRENGVLYNMYLEQRCNARELRLRAQNRRKEAGCYESC